MNVLYLREAVIFIAHMEESQNPPEKDPTVSQDYADKR